MSILLYLLSTVAAAQDGPTADQFVRLMHGLTSNISDVTCPFESESRFVGPAYLYQDDPNRLGTMYEGTFAYRSDGAVLVDYFFRLLDGKSPLNHRTIVILHGEKLQIDSVPDAKSVTPKKQKPTSLASLNATGMPLHIARFWFFQELEDAAPYQYEFLGWETIQDRRCLVVRLNTLPISRENAPYFKFYIDVERNGHPITIEHFRDRRLLARTTVSLARVNLPDGTAAWFPSGGTTETFRWENDYYNEPIFRETYLLLLDSAKFNQGLQDPAFSLMNSPLLANTPELVKLRREFASTPPKARPSADPVTVQAELDTALQRADQNARQLDASRAAAVNRSWTRILQTVLLATGAISLVAVVGWYWWARST